MIDAAKNLKMISTYGVGFDHVDVETPRKKALLFLIVLRVYCVQLLN